MFPPYNIFCNSTNCQVFIYNNKPLSSTFLDDLVTRYKYFIPKTLEEVLDNVFEFDISTVTIKVLIEKLSMYIKSFNSYIQTEKLLEINTWQLVELQNMLYGGNNDVILSMTNYIDRNFGLVGESNTDSKNRILERTITHLILYVKNNLDGIPFMANVVDQLLKDVETSIRIVDLFPKSKRRDIIIYSKTIRYNEFIKDFYRIIVRNINDLPLVINDPKFRNYLSDDQKNVIDYLEPSEVINIYVEYVKSSIEVILKERFGEIDINNSWDDIVPGFSLVTL